MKRRQHNTAARDIKRQRIQPLEETRPCPGNESAAAKDQKNSSIHTNRLLLQSNKIYPRFQTLSIAIPASLLSNVPTKELQTYLMGQLARAAAIHHVDEIILYDDDPFLKNDRRGHCAHVVDKDQDHHSHNSQLTFMARILQYCECPKYLKRHFFPVHPDLRHAGLLPLLDAPHHLRDDEDHSIFREAVVLDSTHSKKSLPKGTSLVDCGIRGPPIL